MKTVELVPVENHAKVGEDTPWLHPNVYEDTIFTSGGKMAGIYLKKCPEKLVKYIRVGNAEFLTERVPKSNMERVKTIENPDGTYSYIRLKQMSTVIGAIPPKPHMRRNYATMTAVHREASAQTFIKAMYKASCACEKVLEDMWPEQAEIQRQLIIDNVPEKFRFGNLFTSSISNFNISAPYHCDRANIVGSVNFIITKKHHAQGGHLHVPDYDLTFAAHDESLIIYPAWANVHGVTPIRSSHPDGYRNSLVFYPLNKFQKLMHHGE